MHAEQHGQSVKVDGVAEKIGIDDLAARLDDEAVNARRVVDGGGLAGTNVINRRRDLLLTFPACHKFSPRNAARGSKK